MPYTNPANMIPERDWMAGGMRGAVAGLNGAYSMRANEQAIKDTDLQFLRDMEKYKQEQDTTPTMAAENELKRKLAGIGSGMADDGTTERVARSKAAAAISSDDETMGSNAEKARQRKDELIVQLAEEAKAKPFDMMNQGDKARWDSWRGEFKKLGTEFPSAPSPEDWMQINAKAQAVINNPAQQRKVMAERQQIQDQGTYIHGPNRASVEREGAANRASAEKIAAGNQEQRLNSSRISAEAKVAAVPRTLMAEAVAAMRKGREGDVDFIVDQMWLDAVSKDPQLKIGALTDPTVKQEFITRAKIQVRSRAAESDTTPSQSKEPSSSGKPPRQAGMPEEGAKRADGATFGIMNGKWGWIKQ